MAEQRGLRRWEYLTLREKSPWCTFCVNGQSLHDENAAQTEDSVSSGSPHGVFSQVRPPSVFSMFCSVWSLPLVSMWPDLYPPANAYRSTSTPFGGSSCKTWKVGNVRNDPYMQSGYCGLVGSGARCPVSVEVLRHFFLVESVKCVKMVNQLIARFHGFHRFRGFYGIWVLRLR